MSDKPPAPSPGALRAARALWPYGVASCYAYNTEEENDAAKLKDWEAKARTIDREINAGELARTLQRLAEKVKRANDLQHSGARVRAEDWAELYTLQAEAFGALDRYNAT